MQVIDKDVLVFSERTIKKCLISSLTYGKNQKELVENLDYLLITMCLSEKTT